jgi:hypothetical protein
VPAPRTWHGFFTMISSVTAVFMIVLSNRRLRAAVADAGGRAVVAGRHIAHESRTPKNGFQFSTGRERQKCRFTW